MHRTFRAISILAALGAATLGCGAQASYFIRPYAQLGFGVVDGYEANGATSGSANFTSAVQAQVDLDQGVVRNYVMISGPDAGGSGFGQAAGIFGDSLTFYGAAGTTIDFSFAFDGTITAPAYNSPSDSILQIGLTANFYVYEAGSGATYANFTSHGGAVAFDTVSLDFSNPSDALDTFVSQTLTSSIMPTSGIAAYDIFASLNIYTSLNDNLGTVEMDFLHTGTFGIAAPPAVTYSSASGVFLDSVPAAPVPEPASWALMIGGFALVGSVIRRRARPVLAFA